jgi:small subunit ribosomal protein S17
MVETRKRSPKSKNGVVVANKMDKTVSVEVRTTVMHPRYKKYIQRRRRFKAHDESNACNIGDKVEIVESRPLSKTKHWRVRKVM